MNRSEVEDGMGFAGLVPTREDRRQEERERLKTEIFYKGFAYNVRSQFGIDSLKSAIERDRNS